MSPPETSLWRPWPNQIKKMTICFFGKGIRQLCSSLISCPINLDDPGQEHWIIWKRTIHGSSTTAVRWSDDPCCCTWSNSRRMRFPPRLEIVFNLVLSLSLIRANQRSGRFFSLLLLNLMDWRPLLFRFEVIGVSWNGSEKVFTIVISPLVLKDHALTVHLISTKEE